MSEKILVAVDGSETSLQAVRYVGDILRDSGGIEVTLLHVLEIPPELLEHGGAENSGKEHRLEEHLESQREKWMQSSQKRMEDEFFAPARKILKQKGIQEEDVQIRMKVTTDMPHPDVAMAIIQEIARGGYGTIVLGRRGKSMLRDFVFGSVAFKVIHHVKNCAIWIVE
jgi:nucleotide-binding universal stress UspA family protein